MKNSKPNPINYNINYKLMTIAKHLLPLLPTATLQRITTSNMKCAEYIDVNAHQMHCDRYDIYADWNMVITMATRHKISQ